MRHEIRCTSEIPVISRKKTRCFNKKPLEREGFFFYLGALAIDKVYECAIMINIKVRSGGTETVARLEMRQLACR